MHNMHTISKRLGFIALIGLFSLTSVSLPSLTPNATAAVNATSSLIFTSLSDHTMPLGNGIGLNVLTTNPNNLPVVVSVISGPGNWSYDAKFSTFNWVPTAKELGINVFTFNATDGINTVTRSITITVTPPTAGFNPPVFELINDIKSQVGNVISIPVKVTSMYALPITVSASLPVGANFDSLTNTLTWVPTAQNIGTTTVIFTASDGYSLVTKSIYIVIEDIPASILPPVINYIANQSVNVGDTLSFNVDAYSPSNLPLSITVNTPRGAIFNANTKTFTWTPKSKDTGSYKIRFKASDKQNSSYRTVEIKVKSVKTKPNRNR